MHEDSTNLTKVAGLLRFISSKSGDEQFSLKEDVGLLAVMQQTAVLLSTVYDISACERAQHLQQAVRLLAVMQQTAVLPNVVYDVSAVRGLRDGSRHGVSGR